MTEKPVLLVPRIGTDDEQRFSEALNRLGLQIISIMDAAVGLRTAAPQVQRERHRAKGALRDALLMIQETAALHSHIGPNHPKERN